MMEWTDRHCRYFHRLLTRRALLYTEMITTGAVIRGDRKRLLGFDPAEHPVAVQLGGCDPQALAESARICADLGYDEINLNVGCPSDRVQEGRFGACLMAEPRLVGACVGAMKAAVPVPVTVKCRIGIDEQDPEAALEALASAVEAAGVDALIVHARKAWLTGLDPKQNREIPPLDYDRVYRLKAAHPRLEIVLNGGIESLEQAKRHLGRTDGAMMGRAAYREPWRLLDADPVLFDVAAPFHSTKAAATALIPYIERELARGTRLHSILRHVHGLFHAVPGARAFRRHLATAAVKPGAGPEVLVDALAMVDRRAGAPGAHAPRPSMGLDVPAGELALLAAAIIAGGVVTGLLAGLFGIGGGARDRTGALRSLPHARGRGRGAHAALRRHIARHHRADNGALLSRPSRQGRGAPGGSCACGRCRRSPASRSARLRRRWHRERCSRSRLCWSPASSPPSCCSAARPGGSRASCRAASPWRPTAS